MPQDLMAYALRCGLTALDGQQLRRLDSIALATVRGLPKDLSSTDHHVDRQMHDLRLAIDQEQRRRVAQWAGIMAECAGLDQPEELDPLDPDEPTAPEPTDQERAVLLLRAALQLIMHPPNGSGGGSGAKLIPPTPKLPPSGQALTPPRGLQYLTPATPQPRSTPRDDIQF